MAKLPDFGKMIGPLPLGAWLAVVGGGLGFAYYTRRQADSTGSDVADRETLENPNVGVGGSGQFVDVTPPDSTSTSGGAPTTNDEWGTQAVRYLTGLGYPAIQVDQAVRRYLAAEQLAASEATMISVAIQGIGPTPQVLPPPIVGVPTSPPPTPTPARRPYTYHTVLVTENLPIIALKYKKNIVDLWNANNNRIVRLDGSNGFLTSYALHRGQVLVIPWVTPVNKGFNAAYRKKAGIA